MVGYLIPLDLAQEGRVIQGSPVAQFEDAANTGTTDLAQHAGANWSLAIIACFPLNRGLTHSDGFYYHRRSNNN